MRLRFNKGQNIFVVEGTPEEMAKFMETFGGSVKHTELSALKEPESPIVRRGRYQVPDGYPSALEFEKKLRDSAELQQKSLMELIVALGLQKPRGITAARVRMRYMRARRKLGI